MKRNTEIGSLVDPTYDANLEYNQLSRYKHSEIRHASEPGESKHQNTRKPKPRKKNKKTHRKK